MTASQALKERLVAEGVNQLRVFPGSKSASAEAVAQEVLRAFDLLAAGDFDLSIHSATLSLR